MKQLLLDFLFATLALLPLFMLVANPVVILAGLCVRERAARYFKPAAWLTATAQIGLGVLFWLLLRLDQSCLSPAINALMALAIGGLELGLLLELALLGAVWWLVLRRHRLSQASGPGGSSGEA